MVSSIGAIAGCWAPKVPRRRRHRVWCRSSVFRAGTACERMPPRYRRGSPMSEISGAARRWGRASGVRARQFVGRARDRRSERCIAAAHVPIWSRSWSQAGRALRVIAPWALWARPVCRIRCIAGERELL